MSDVVTISILAASLTANVVLIVALVLYSRQAANAAALGRPSTPQSPTGADPAEASVEAGKAGHIQRFCVGTPGPLTDLTVLVADDDPTNIEVLVEMLKLLGLNTLVTASNGREAVSCAGQTRFDLIFMDIQMPVMTGIDAARIILAEPRNENVPIIAITGFSRIVNASLCEEAGMQGFLQKPVHLDALTGEIEKVRNKDRRRPRQSVATGSAV